MAHQKKYPMTECIVRGTKNGLVIFARTRLVVNQHLVNPVPRWEGRGR